MGPCGCADLQISAFYIIQNININDTQRVFTSTERVSRSQVLYVHA